MIDRAHDLPIPERTLSSIAFNPRVKTWQLPQRPSFNSERSAIRVKLRSAGGFGPLSSIVTQPYSSVCAQVAASPGQFNLGRFALRAREAKPSRQVEMKRRLCVYVTARDHCQRAPLSSRIGDPDIPRSISTLTPTGPSGWPTAVASIHCPFNDSMNIRAVARRATPSGRIGLNQSR